MVAARLITPQEAGQTSSSHRCHETDRWTHGYALQVLHREERSLLSSLILQEGTQVVRYPRADILRYQWARDYAAFSASHIPAVRHSSRRILPSVTPLIDVQHQPPPDSCRSVSKIFLKGRFIVRTMRNVSKNGSIF